MAGRVRMVIAKHSAPARPLRTMGRDQRSGVNFEAGQRFRVHVARAMDLFDPRACAQQDAATLVGCCLFRFFQ